MRQRPPKPHRQLISEAIRQLYAEDIDTTIIMYGWKFTRLKEGGVSWTEYHSQDKQIEAACEKARRA